MAMRKFVRLALRSVWLCAELLLINADFAFLVLRNGGSPPLRARMLWLQRSCRRVLRVLAVAIESTGPCPLDGLVVSNHLSYLDILVLGTLMPAVFVSKSEVMHWPVFGWFARMAGTLFLDRTRRADVARISEQITTALRDGHLVVLFPEGTSSDGTQVLPFRSSLLEPVKEQDLRLSVACIGYAVADGSAENDVCYWGEVTFFPHLVKLMARKKILACVRFGVVERGTDNRKDLARRLHAEVVRLKTMSAA
jgi:1-acyl-sn-glycerol-3-phosphate acyltransferase